jgi:hypothetical protein
VRHQEWLPSSASNSPRLYVSFSAPLLKVAFAHQPQNHPANIWWGSINIHVQQFQMRQAWNYYFLYLNIHMSTGFLMIVPYMFVRKLLATPIESANKRSLLLMDRLNMFVQIGFLHFNVDKNENDAFFVTYIEEKNL